MEAELEIISVLTRLISREDLLAFSRR